MPFALHALTPPTAPQPVLALVFYQHADATGEPDLSVVRHAIHLTACGPLLGAGQAVADADLMELNDLLHRRERRAEPPRLLPSTVLCIHDTLWVWWLPAAVRPLPVRQGERTFVLRAPWPALVLAVREQQFYVAALARNRRPTPNTPLYHAPLMNVGASGRVCTGNAELPPAVGLDALAGWEAVLTDTYFTHVNHPRTLHLEPPAAPATETAPPPPSTAPGEANTHQHLHLWRELARTRAIRFPKTALAPMGTTLQQFFNRLAQAR